MSANAAAEATPSFAHYYGAIALHPTRAFASLVNDAQRLRLGSLAIASNAALYTLVYVFLVLGGGRPTVFKPWLAIDPESYYRWELVLLAPSMFAGWLLAGAVTHLLARLYGGRGTFEDTLSVLGFGTAIASWWTLLHDLVTTFLGAIHVIDQRAYEDAMSTPTVFRTILWALMAAYLIAFVVLFSKGIAAAQRLEPRRAWTLGVAAFVVYQLVFITFNR